MRTTLDIDEDILFATRDIAKRQGLSMGKVLSDLARQALSRQTAKFRLDAARVDKA